MKKRTPKRRPGAGRTAEITRKTKETDIALKLAIDGTGDSHVDTGIPFFDHLLGAAFKHGFFDVQIKARGDLDVDLHHTVEDVGIVLGQAFHRALDGYKGIRRYGHGVVPMTETLTEVAVDLSNRPHFVYNVQLPARRISNFDLELVEEFLRAFGSNAQIDLHVNTRYGRNSHHIVESVFKALGRALDAASTVDARVSGAHSTKGML
jgi:imidazoleglycerol-phosphate dehydratase